MARAAVQFERTGDGGWTPIGVWYGVPRRLTYRMLPGDPGRDSFARLVAETTTRPADPDTGVRGTWEDWIGWATYHLTNGHDRHVVEVRPETSVDRTYDREVLGTRPRPVGGPRRPEVGEVPAGLGGPRTAAARRGGIAP